VPPTLRLSRLPPAQRALFPRLSFLRPGFVLYGGTAVALQTGHRDSENFDFFSSEALPEAAKRSLAAEFADHPLEVLQDTGDTLTLDVESADAVVRLSFFGRIRVPRLDLPCAAATGPRVASRLDLAGFKLAMAYQRHEENDVADVAALLESGTTLAEAVGAMRRIYGDQAPWGRRWPRWPISGADSLAAGRPESGAPGSPSSGRSRAGAARSRNCPWKTRT